MYLAMTALHRVGVVGLVGAAAEGGCGAATLYGLEAAQWLHCGTSGLVEDAAQACCPCWLKMLPRLAVHA